MTILTLPSSLILLSMVIPVTAVTQEARARSELSRASVDGVELEYEVQVGDRAGAVNALMRVVSGPDYRSVLDRALPGAFEHAVRNRSCCRGPRMCSTCRNHGRWPSEWLPSSSVIPSGNTCRGVSYRAH